MKSDLTESVQSVGAAQPSPFSLSVEEAAALFETVAANGTDGIGFTDCDHRYHYVNAALARIHGISIAAHVGKTIADAVGPDYWRSLEPSYRQALSGETANGVRVFGALPFRPDFTYHFEASYYPVRIDGEVVGVASVVREVTAQVAAEEARQETARQRWVFVRDMLASVTEGRLRLCAASSDLPPLLEPVGSPLALTPAHGVRDLRRCVEQVAQKLDFPMDRLDDLVIATGEAAINAVIHAGAGIGHVGTDGRTIQVRVEDQGRGISVEDLPRAAFRRGYSSAGTLGQGMKMILQTTDRIWLLTGLSGTTIVLEQDRTPPESLSRDPVPHPLTR